MAHRVAAHADDDLDDIWGYVAKESGSIEVANRLVDSITDRFFLVSSHPYPGRARDHDYVFILPSRTVVAILTRSLGVDNESGNVALGKLLVQ